MIKKEKDLYIQLDSRANSIYKFVTLYSDYMKSVHDYGTGERIHMVEVHTLTYIAEHPGITAGKIAIEWNRTKSAMSQIVRKLENRGFIVRQKEKGNAKNVHLYVTDKGKELSDAHKDYDIKDLTWAYEKLREEFTEDEIDSFYKILDRYTLLLNESRD